MWDRWRRWRGGAQRRRLARTIAGVRRRSEWLAKRPFSDKYDGDSPGGGYFSSPGARYGGEEEALRKRRNWR